MPKLPKSVVIEGRRYPTWALSSRAREQLVNLHLVDAHIAELRQRLALYSAAYQQGRASLRQALSEPTGSEQVLPERAPPKEAPAVEQRYFWHILPLAWGKANFPMQTSVLNLHAIGAGGYYQEGDQLLLYVKGYGVVGWGAVEANTPTEQLLSLRFQAASLDDALPASALKAFSLRHPNRASQQLPKSADVEGLLAELAALPAA
ncbi:hypothetical protein LOS15_03280 [Halomonas sp. 7T]|uniref:hypothetical protein n=1 Tax=Halomonas sp. 7T TaxID=2893469 RepID=UPI0021DA0C28|nr:hypothetical protein [Halomonas sp. 7T]UXZ55072.1 hypothetical protein LOS15_03280 [Halomonas sp. 7T]